MDLNTILERDKSFRYQLLDRMRSDCDFYLGHGRFGGNHLWAGTVEEQIEHMKAIWNSFSEEKGEGKPEWLTWEKIEWYEQEMLTYPHLKKGDYVETPRFLRVKISEILLPSQCRCPCGCEPGFTEPTHYEHPYYDIFGKHVGENRMIFAAVLKYKQIIA